MSRFDEEEDFHARDRKQFRKERKLAQKKDRSKFKKTDQPGNEKQEVLTHLPRRRVVAISGEGIWVDQEGERKLCSLKGVLKKSTDKTKNLIAVGDFVRLGPDYSIEQIEERTSRLNRTDISGRKEQLIAANVDLVIIVISILNPPLKSALVDRYLIAAQKGNIQPIIVINKLDLLENAPPVEKEKYTEFLTAYEKLGFPVLSISVYDKTGIDALRSIMKDKVSVFSGQSGVGKSSLLNISFQMERNVGDLAAKTFKGTHTTTQAELLPLPDGGYCIDTPGIRSFGVWNIQKEDLIHHFSEITTLGKKCKFQDCNHINEPDCKVLKALEKGKISLIRYESYLTLLEEIKEGPASKTWE